jgi:uncharacterized protein YlxP (DUF503 family)
MPFQKGQSGNPAGRTKGSNYKMSTEQRDFLRYLLRKNKEKFELQLEELKGRDFIHTYATLMQYVLPKPATAEVKEVPQLEEFIAMTPEERQVAMEEIRESINNGK